MDMPARDPQYDVTSLEDLKRIYTKDPADGVLRKVTDHITAPGRKIIEAAPFCILATSDENGIDTSPKGDAPGFVKILDERTLLVPDRPGNNRIDGMKNVLKNPQVGLIFMVPGVNETYRINGRGRISIDPALLDKCLVNGKRPRSVLVVSVVEAFPHCPKAFVRSNLWKAGAAGRPAGVPTIGHFAADRDGKDDAYAEQYTADYGKRMPGELY